MRQVYLVLVLKLENIPWHNVPTNDVGDAEKQYGCLSD